MLAESSNQVLFKVRPDANKIEIRKQVEALFKVTVLNVRTARYLGKMRRVRQEYRTVAAVEEGVRHAERWRSYRFLRASVRMMRS